MNSQIFMCLKQLKVAILTLMVLGSFVIISLGWNRIGTSPSAKCQLAAVILVTMYILIIFEFVNRNLAALIGAAMSIAAYDSLVGYANAEEIIGWEDLDTLALLFGMMIIVNVLNYSGIFDFLAVWSYKSSRGHFWLLISSMSFISGFLSSIIDNVSTMLLMTPTIIRLSELENIDPRYLLIIMVIASNIGGCATPVGDPPNLIIIGSSLAKSLQISFGTFTAYVSPVAILALASVLLYLRLIYKSKESFRLEQSSDAMPRKQTDNQSQMSLPLPQHLSHGNNMDELMLLYGIKSKAILIRALIVLVGTIILFFLQALPGTNLTLGSISIFAGLTLLVMCSSLKVPKSGAEQEDGDGIQEEVDLFEEVINKIEWSTLIFFFALFIVMEAMTKLGLTLYLGNQVTELIKLLPSGRSRSIGAISIILWFSGIASACIDNVPFTLVMVRVLNTMVSEMSDSLDARPLVYALVLGACLGGNGSLIGASCNLITAGISSQHGYPISYNSFFKFAAPITVLTLIVSNIYLIFVFELLKL